MGIAPDVKTRFVFSSRHGEYARTFSMLRSLAAEGTVSPADFSIPSTTPGRPDLHRDEEPQGTYRAGGGTRQFGSA
jgi:hypothetical protein